MKTNHDEPLPPLPPQFHEPVAPLPVPQQAEALPPLVTVPPPAATGNLGQEATVDRPQAGHARTAPLPLPTYTPPARTAPLPLPTGMFPKTAHDQPLVPAGMRLSAQAAPPLPTYSPPRTEPLPVVGSGLDAKGPPLPVAASVTAQAVAMPSAGPDAADVKSALPGGISRTAHDRPLPVTGLSSPAYQQPLPLGPSFSGATPPGGSPASSQPASVEPVGGELSAVLGELARAVRDLTRRGETPAREPQMLVRE